MWQDFMARMMKTDNLSALADMAQTVNNSGNHIGQQFGNVTVIVQAAQDRKQANTLWKEFAKVAAEPAQRHYHKGVINYGRL